MKILISSIVLLSLVGCYKPQFKVGQCLVVKEFPKDFFALTEDDLTAFKVVKISNGKYYVDTITIFGQPGTQELDAKKADLKFISLPCEGTFDSSTEN